jgi:UDP-galactose transporter B1
MARTKQATPLRRDPSSEYFSRDTSGTPSRSPGSWDKEKSNSGANGHKNGSITKSSTPKAQTEAGLIQLLIAVGGIYASLYSFFLLVMR